MHLHVCLFSSRSVKANGVLVYLSPSLVADVALQPSGAAPVCLARGCRAKAPGEWRTQTRCK